MEGIDAFSTTGSSWVSSEFNASHKHEGDWQATLQRRSHRFRRLVVQAQVVHGSRYQQPFAEAEQPAVRILNAAGDCTDATLTAQLYNVSVMLSTDTALDKCHNAGINEGIETWRQFTVEWEPKLMSRYVGLLLQILSFQCDGDMSATLSSFERLVRDYEVQSRKALDDDFKMHDSRVKVHLIRNTARLDTWIKTRDKILEIARTQRYINAQLAPTQLGATQKGKGKCKEQEKGKPKATPPPPPTVTASRTATTFQAKGTGKESYCNRERVLLLQEERACEGGLPQTAEGSSTGGRAASDWSRARQSASNTITPQLGALPRVENSMSMNFLLATPLYADAWTRTHHKGYIEQSDAGSTPPWLKLNSLPGGQCRVMIDCCAGASVFHRRYDDTALDDHHVQPVWLATSTGEPVEAATGKRSFSLHDGRGMSTRYNDADVKFPFVSVSEVTQQGFWFVLGLGTQLMVAREDAHPSRPDPRETREWAWTRAKSMLNVLDALSSTVFSAMVTKGQDEYAFAVVAEALRFAGRERVILLSDQEKPIKKLAELVRDNLEA